MVDPVYTTREVVKAALDSAETARNNAQVDRCIASASRAVEGILHRPLGGFAPQVATRYFPWPNDQNAKPWRLWLDEHELISVTTLTAGGTTISASDFFLEPVNNPPYDSIEIDLDSSAAFSAGDTHQRAIAITGVWGDTADEAPAGALAEALDDSETAVDVSDSATIGVGSILRVDSERFLVTGKSMLDTGQNIGANLDANKAATTVAVATGSAYSAGETILVDAERMLVEDIAGNNLIVQRAFDGSTLAAHTSGADVYAPRTLTVVRGALGTTAATHSTSAAIYVHQVPALVAELCVALALITLGQRQAGYARTVGSGDSEREASGRGLAQIRKDAIATYGRLARTAAV